MSENIEENYKYTKIFLETIIDSAFDKICSRDDGKELFVDPNSMKSGKLTASERQAVKLTGEQLEKIVSQKNGIFLCPQGSEAFYRPNLVISNLEALEEELKQYYKRICHSEKNFYKIDKEHNMATYFYYLIKTLTNSDCQDFLEYIKVFNGFLDDNNFDSLRHEKSLGKIDLEQEGHKYDVLAKRTEEYYGSETPYTMRYALERKGFRFTMPFVRYGISGKKAYIYSIQRKGKINLNYSKIKKINGEFNKVNSGVKSGRDITPAMLISATIFIGMLKKAGIEEVKIADFLTRRFGHYNGINSNYEEACKVQANTTDKFLKTYIRLVSQFSGIDITSYPNDVDSFLSLKLGDNISSTNKLLDTFFRIGLEYDSRQEDLER